MAIINFGISDLQSISYDNIYLSLTEVRTGSWATGTVNLYSNDGSMGNLLYPSSPFPLSDIFNGLNFVNSFTGLGIGGNHILLDVTSSITNTDISNGYKGFVIYDEIFDTIEYTNQNGDTYNLNRGFAALGKNYNSGFPNQYWATSYYEYPTLIATVGTNITPFHQLPRRTIIYPDPTAIPTPSAILLGTIGMGLTGWIRKRRRL